MSVLNVEVAAKFDELADLLEFKNENPFRVRAYRNAARLIESLPHEAADLIREGKDLSELPGIGKDLAEKITTLIKTKELPLLEQTRKGISPAVVAMMNLPGLGPKRVRELYDLLKIKTLADLKAAANEGKIQNLPGFGAKTEQRILAAIKQHAEIPQRLIYAEAEKIALPLVKYLKSIQGIGEVVVAGSFRRAKETVGDLDILATCCNEKISAQTIIDQFVKYPYVAEVIAKGDTKAMVNLRLGIQVDLRVVAPESFGAALLYFTGSKEHTVGVRLLAVKKKFKLNEYGLFQGKKNLSCKTEAEIYDKVGLRYIEPEMRENRGEVELAKKNSLPKLITLADIKGDLHCHSTYSGDASGTLEEMAEAAKKLGYEYLAITDHSRHLTIAKGLDEKRLASQIAAIDKLNSKLKNFRILKSLECDILADGSLDLSNDILSQLDLVVCSIHSRFNLSREEQTQRILKAMDNPYFTIWGHPTGRLIGSRVSRPPYAIDLEKIMLKAKERNIFLEINAQPERLDLDDVHCHMAKDIGVKLTISSDAHDVRELKYLRFGINQARRGWLAAEDVLNTYSLEALLKKLKEKR